ncbi:MAG: FAD-dependent oxidoreductase [Polyangiaceae bacterium]
MPLGHLDFLTATQVVAGVYTLGSLEKRLSVRSQQVRALNLVEALFATNTLRAGQVFAVVGGGAAGLTAAVRAAERGAKVVVIEKHHGLLPILSGCEQRLLHPHLYDWPADGWEAEDAGLPILDWPAGSARSVADRMAEEFARAQQRFGIMVHTATSVTDFTPGSRVRVSCTPGGPIDADAVALAVGFGWERDLDAPTAGAPHDEVLRLLWRRDVRSYWRDDDHGSAGVEGGTRKYLISGAGDGGLIDLLRVRLKNMSQETLVDRLLPNAAPDVKEIRARLRQVQLEIERAKLSPEDEARIWTKTLAEPMAELDARLRDQLRPDSEAILITRRADWASGSFLLNRLLAARLFVSDPKTRLAVGEFDPKEIRTAGGGYEVRVGGAAHQFTHLIVRNGRRKAFEGFAAGDAWRVAVEGRWSTPHVDLTDVPVSGVVLAPKPDTQRRTELRQAIRRSNHRWDLAEALALFLGRWEAEAAPRPDQEADYTQLEELAAAAFDDPDDAVVDLAKLEACVNSIEGYRCDAAIVARAIFRQLDAMRGEMLVAARAQPIQVASRGLFVTARARLLTRPIGAIDTRYLHVAPSAALDVHITVRRHSLVATTPAALRSFAGVVARDVADFDAGKEPRDVATHVGRLRGALAAASTARAELLLFPEASVPASAADEVQAWWDAHGAGQLLLTAGKRRCRLQMAGHDEEHLASSGGRRSIRLAATAGGTIAVVFGDELTPALASALAELGTDLLLLPHFGPATAAEGAAASWALGESDALALLATVPDKNTNPYGFFATNGRLARVTCAGVPAAAPFG